MTDETITHNDGLQYSVRETDVAHLAGVIDAVGNISANVSNDADYRLNYTIRPMIQLLRPNEDDLVLRKLMAYCDEQGVKYSIFEKGHGSGRDSSSIEFNTKDPESIRRFLEPMMDYLVTKYFEADLMLNGILPGLEADKHREKQGFYELMGLVDEMRKNKSRTQNVIYNQEYFAEEWADDLELVN